MSALASTGNERLVQSVLVFTDDAALGDNLGRLADGGRIASAELIPGGLPAAMSIDRLDADVVVVDISNTENPVAGIEDLAQRIKAKVLAVGQQNDARIYRDVCRAGAIDYLVLPTDEASLADALQTNEVAEDPVDDEECRVSLVIGARGGVGASSLAVGTAWLAAEKFHRQTALVDMDFHFGTCALALDLLPGRGLREALEHPERIDSLFIGSAMVNVGEKLFLLGGEEAVDQELFASAYAIDQLIDAIRGNFQSMIVDLPRQMAVAQPALVGCADEIVMVSDLSLPGLRDTIRLRDWLQGSGCAANLRIVLQEGPPRRAALTRKDFEKGLEGKVDFVLPHADKVAAMASAQGKPLPEAAGLRSPLSKAMTAIASNFVTGLEDEGAKRRLKWLRW